MNRSIEPTIHTIRALDNFSSWLLQKLEETGMSHGELAREIGVSRKTILGYCNRHCYPRLDVMAEIYAYFDENWIQIPIYK